MFRYEEFLPQSTYEKINEIKTFYPEIIREEMQKRKRPGYPHQRLVFVAADHNARMIQTYKGNPLGLSNRREYLARAARMLSAKSVDGLEATADIMEDLFALAYLYRQETGEDLLAGKMMIGTVNRGGLKDVAWELDDMKTGYTIEHLKQMNLDGAKFMLRIHPDCEVNKHTLRYCTETVNEAAEAGLPIFIEGLFVRTVDQEYQIQTDLESLVKTVGVVSALGTSSLGKWIELPLNPEYAKATAASTSSFLVVPDEYARIPEEIVKEYTAQCGCAANVRGILLGRNVMYSETDPCILAEQIATYWHKEE